MNYSMMTRRLIPLFLALFLGSVSGLRAQFIWTGINGSNGSILDALNWALHVPLVPSGSGTEDLQFGDLPLTPILGTQTYPLLPTITLRDFDFVGNSRPAYTFGGLSGTQTLTLNGKMTVNSNSTNTVTFDGSVNVALSNGSHSFDVTNTTLSIFGSIGQTGGTASIAKNGSGLLYLAGNNTFSGGIAVNAGSLFLRAGYTASGTGTITMSSGAELWPFDGAAIVPNAVSLGGGTAIFNSIGATDSLTLNGNVSGSGGFTKKGPGQLTLNGTNSYNGTTTIQSGTVVVGANAALGTNTVFLDGGTLTLNNGVTLANTVTFATSGGTISGAGTFAAPISVGAFDTISPGFSPGILSFSSGLTLAASGTLTFEVQTAAGSAGTGYDLLSVSGAVLNITATAGSPFTISLRSLNGAGSAGNVADFSAATPYTWTIANSAAGITNFASSKFLIDASGFTNGLGGGTFSVSATGTSLYLNFTPVPEPSTYVLMALGLGMAVMGLRRRRA